MGNDVISSPASWPLPLGMAFASAGAVSTVSAVLSSLMLAVVSWRVCDNQSVLMCQCARAVSVLSTLDEASVVLPGSVEEKMQLNWQNILHGRLGLLWELCLFPSSKGFFLYVLHRVLRPQKQSAAQDICLVFTIHQRKSHVWWINPLGIGINDLMT